MPTTIRAADAGEAAALDILRRQAIEATYSDALDRSAFADLVATPDDALADRITDDDHRVLVAEDDHAQVGYVVSDREVARVRGVYVAPGRQREGLGSALLDRGTPTDATVRAAAPTPVVEFFLANGFERTGSATWNGLDAVAVARS